MDNFWLLFLAIVPPIGILFYFFSLDNRIARNKTYVFYSFFIGGILAIPIVLSESFLINNIFKMNAFTISFLVAGLVEEGFKFIGILFN